MLQLLLKTISGLSPLALAVLLLALLLALLWLIHCLIRRGNGKVEVLGLEVVEVETGNISAGKSTSEPINDTSESTKSKASKNIISEKDEEEDGGVFIIQKTGNRT
jgi:hypothetical protein